MTHEPDDKKEPKDEDGSDQPRKERVLHTRIPAVLEKELKRAAASLRVPVSNLVRTILEDALATAQAVGRAAEEELKSAAERLGEDRDPWQKGAEASGESIGKKKAEAKPGGDNEPSARPAKEAHEGIVGYQPFVLTRPTQCSLCEKVLEPGTTAFVGIRIEDGPKVIAGEECVPETKRPE